MGIPETWSFSMKRILFGLVAAAMLVPSAAMAQFNFNMKVSSSTDDDVTPPPAVVVAPAPVVVVQQQPVVVQQQAVVAAPTGMDHTAFMRLRNSLAHENFDMNRVNLVKQAMGHPNAVISCAQATEILKIFEFSNNRLNALKAIAPKLADKQNDFMILDAFEFQNDKNQARKILG